MTEVRLDPGQVKALADWQAFLGRVAGSRANAKKATPGQWSKMSGAENVEFKMLSGSNWSLKRK